ncbi:ZIP family metal transporter [Fuchsiella alkaliacetigena]|uniref:ZIP family metal transporter n=1 Tax=Fuchsiella alkaliacetigena TaxID=957042 RepID=UPI00200A7FD8|nr:ZIP family metal transporter [Fuchsiella alkaliacetigena]MCK8825172.1 ZIP family metal transporter [Fuchsiella alkaliacetigena]
MGSFLKMLLYSSLAGGALVLGGYLGTKKLPDRVLSFILSLGAGILLSLISFSLIPEAYRKAGIWGCSVSFMLGGLFFLGADDYIERRFKTSVGMALGSFLDSVPESISIGIGFASGDGGLGLVLAVSILMHNIPEGFLSAEEMIYESELNHKWVYLIIGVVALINPLGAIFGYHFLSNLAEFWLGSIMSFAGGAILYLIAHKIIPKAYKTGSRVEIMGILIGFLVSFLLGKIFIHN